MIVDALLIMAWVSFGWRACRRRSHIADGGPTPGREWVPTPPPAPRAVPAAARSRPSSVSATHPAGVSANHPELRGAGTGLSSVLGWERFRLISVLPVDSSVILACRRVRPGFSRAADDDATRIGAGDRTMVLFVGDDERTPRALAMLERWRRTDSILTLRPTGQPRAIELADGESAVLRAPVVVA